MSISSLWTGVCGSALLGSLVVTGSLTACGTQGGLPTDGATGGAASGGAPAGSGGAAAGGTVGSGGASPAGGSASGGALGSGGVGTGGQSSGGADGSGGLGTGGNGAGGGSGGGGSGDAMSEGCGTERTLMNGQRTIGSRQYILRVPDDYDNTHPYRLIMAYHWRDGNASQVANGGEGGSTEDPYYGLWDLAEGSTIFVAPQGLNNGWSNSNGDDVDLTDAILAEIQGDLCIDTSRIFATGFSFGGGMSYALACARADVFRGVAVYSGSQLSGCDGGTTPIAYFAAHGANDDVLNISQGRGLRDHYVDVNGCTAQNPPEPGVNSGTHTCTSYDGCSEGHPVRWCAHGGGHNPTEKDSGQSKSWVPGEAWTFISQF